jgi:hypothetical protein
MTSERRRARMVSSRRPCSMNLCSSASGLDIAFSDTSSSLRSSACAHHHTQRGPGQSGRERSAAGTIPLRTRSHSAPTPRETYLLQRNHGRCRLQARRRTRAKLRRVLGLEFALRLMAVEPTRPASALRNFHTGVPTRMPHSKTVEAENLTWSNAKLSSC